MEKILFVLKIVAVIVQASHVPHADLARDVYLAAAAASYFGELLYRLLGGER
jgi:hypothetical protein